MSLAISSQNKEILEGLELLPDVCTSAVALPVLSNTTSPRRGRKTFAGIHPGVVVAKLARAFLIGCDVNEACVHAGISRHSYYRFCRKYPEIRNFLEECRMPVTISARIAIADAIRRGNPWVSFKYLDTVGGFDESHALRQNQFKPAAPPKIIITVHDPRQENKD